MIDLLAWTTTGWIVAVLIGLLYLAVFWVIFDVVTRPDFSGVMKAVWVLFAILFSVITVPIYLLWVRKQDYATRR